MYYYFFFADNRFWLKICFAVTYGNAEYGEKKKNGKKKVKKTKKKRWFSVENIVSFGADDGT